MEQKQNPKMKKLHKLAQDWATATMDPDIKDMAHDLMAAFAFTSTPQLAKVISSMAKDPKTKDAIIKKVSPFIGWQGDPLYSDKEVQPEPMNTESGMGMGMTPPTAETKPEPMGPTETAMPAAQAPQPSAGMAAQAMPAVKNAPQAQPFKPGINAAPEPTASGAVPESLGMRFDESNLYSE